MSDTMTISKAYLRTSVSDITPPEKPVLSTEPDPRVSLYASIKDNETGGTSGRWVRFDNNGKVTQ